MNKKGSSLTVWVFTIITILVFVAVLQSQVLSPMNDIYNQSLSTGLNTSTLDSFDSFRQTADTEIGGSEVSQTAQGLTLLGTWNLIKGIFNTITDFLNGSFIYTLADMLDLPPIIPTTIIMMIWISLILIIIYLFMRVVP